MEPPGFASLRIWPQLWSQFWQYNSLCALNIYRPPSTYLLVSPFTSNNLKKKDVSAQNKVWILLPTLCDERFTICACFSYSFIVICQRPTPNAQLHEHLGLIWYDHYFLTYYHFVALNSLICGYYFTKISMKKRWQWTPVICTENAP